MEAAVKIMDNTTFHYAVVKSREKLTSLLDFTRVKVQVIENKMNSSVSYTFRNIHDRQKIPLHHGPCPPSWILITFLVY